MGTKFHITAKGEPAICRALDLGRCPRARFSDHKEHYDSMEEAREGYEKSKSFETLNTVRSQAKTRLKALPNDIFLSVLDSQQQPLRELDSSQVSTELTPGTYSAVFFNEKTRTDQNIVLHVNDDLTVEYEAVKKFTPLAKPTSPKVYQAFQNANAKFKALASDPITCAEKKLDIAILQESRTMFDRVLLKYNLKDSDDALRAKAAIEDLDWGLAEDEASAVQAGDLKILRTIKEARKPIIDFLNEARP